MDLSNTSVQRDENWLWSIECVECGVFMDREEKDDVIKAWNIRKPMERIVERLEREYDLADKEKSRFMVENTLQFEQAKGYATGIDAAIEIVKGGGVDEVD